MVRKGNKFKMKESVFVIKVGSTSLGFRVSQEVQQTLEISSDGIAQVQILQIMKPDNTIIPLENIFLIKRLTKGGEIIIKKSYIDMLHIEDGDLLTIEYKLE
ncbi:MAG: hypothetical protein GF364_01640 [Candidatus Lokiarchaeota archaeon]|nr:hypothetical protein [Candidatus Lokiarchaeota archaeon]